MPIFLALLATALGATSGSFPFGILCGLTVGLVLLRREQSIKTDQIQRELDLLRARIEENRASDKAVSQTRRLHEESETTATDESDSSDTSSTSEITISDALESSKSERSTPLASKAVESTRESVDGFALPGQSGPTQSQNGAEVQTSGKLGLVDSALNTLKTLVWSYFTDGNVFVRIGLLVLFVGVAFLLRYAAENSLIPVQLRYIGAAVVGVVLLSLGWRFRLTNRMYALLLQGGGIGVIYITIFAAYQRAELLPSGLAFALLVLFAVFTALLAVLQNARGLAMFATLGGFLAPFLASSGSGNYIGLFSYYALLNTSVLAIAWNKSWRQLNLMGFVFTFVVFGVWYLFEFKQAMLVPAASFLLLFFLMYSLLGVVYALKQAHSLRGVVDGTLVFGTPLITSSIFMAMFRDYEYGIALVAAGLGVYYVLISRFLWNRSGDSLKLMAEAMLAIGVVFATLAIPYALSGHWTSATWALEAAGILWVSLRQNRIYAQWFAVIVQIGAGVFFLVTNADDVANSAWLNPAFMGGLFIALGSLVSAKLLYNTEHRHPLKFLSPAFFVWGVGWWLHAAGRQIDHYYSPYANEGWLLLLAATAAGAMVLDVYRQWRWKSISTLAGLLLPLLALMAWGSSLQEESILTARSTVPWLLSLGACYWVICELESQRWTNNLLIAWHCAFAILCALIFSHDLLAFLQRQLPTLGSAYQSIVVLPLLLLVYLAQKELLPATQRVSEVLGSLIVVSSLVLLGAWSLVANLSTDGNTHPLPYIPFLNALDIANLAVFFFAAAALPRLQKTLAIQANTMFISIGALCFVWLSAVLIRALHHYRELPFETSQIFDSATVQTSLSILWTAIGMAAMLFASKKDLRPLWIAAASLIGVVLVKMFFVDLDASGTVERIVSFMVVGLMLVALGYFSPIPDKELESKHKAEI